MTRNLLSLTSPLARAGGPALRSFGPGTYRAGLPLRTATNPPLEHSADISLLAYYHD